MSEYDYIIVCTKTRLGWLNLPHLIRLPPVVTAKQRVVIIPDQPEEAIIAYYLSCHAWYHKDLLPLEASMVCRRFTSISKQLNMLYGKHSPAQLTNVYTACLLVFCCAFLFVSSF